MNMPAYDYRQAQAQTLQPAPRTRGGFASFAMRLLAVVCLIGILGVMVFAQSMVTARQVQIRDLKEKVNLEMSRQSRLTEEIHTQGNISRIMDEAASLGMGYPDADSVLYITPSTGEESMMAGR